MIDAVQLREYLNYDPLTGIFTRASNRSVRRWRKGQIAGSRHSKHGYWIIRINKKDYLAHRLAWLYVTGEWPTKDIDHKDGDKTNNAFENLREVSEIHNSQNQRRAHKGSKSGILGVYQKGSRWVSTICIDKKPKHLGSFSTPEAAYAAYIAAKRIYHPGCTI
jgi:hypothetical protein